MSAPSALSASVGRRIRELRVASGASVAALARKAGLRGGALAAIESGKERPSVATLEAIAGALHTTVVVLVKSASSPETLGPIRVAGGLAGIARAVTELPDTVGDKLDAVEAAVVEHAMEVTEGNRSAAARLLGMERKALIRRWQRAQRESKSRARKSV